MEVFLKRYRCEGWLHNIRYTTLSKGQKLQSKEGQQDSESGRWDGTAHLGIYGHFKQQRKLWDVDEIIICKSCSFFPWKAEGQLGMFPVFLTLGSRKEWSLMNWRREILDRLLNSSWLPNFCSVEEAVAILIKNISFLTIHPFYTKKSTNLPTTIEFRPHTATPETLGYPLQLAPISILIALFLTPKVTARASKSTSFPKRTTCIREKLKNVRYDSFQTLEFEGSDISPASYQLLFISSGLRFEQWFRHHRPSRIICTQQLSFRKGQKPRRSRDKRRDFAVEKSVDEAGNVPVDVLGALVSPNNARCWQRDFVDGLNKCFGWKLFMLNGKRKMLIALWREKKLVWRQRQRYLL